MITKLRIWWFLRRLGRTSNEVAANLARAGAKGYRASPNSCPVARRMIEHFKLPHWDVMIGSHVRICGKDVAAIPDPVADFIYEFDHDIKHRELLDATK